MKKIIRVFLSMVLCMCILGMNCYAAKIGDPLIVDGSRLLRTNYAQSWDDNAASTNGINLSTGGCSISKVNSYVATVHGYTDSYHIADTVYVGVYMDRYNPDDGSWSTVFQDSYTANNTVHAGYTKDVFVKKGYYYRVRAAHIVEKDGLREGNTSYTDGILFD
ncbi:MAG: DUF6147 family protein [Eubacteriales bacterium]|nr:DUF6147 family protein [Eubacteriales bacterium]